MECKEKHATPKGIRYYSFCENSGYGIAARRYILGLAAAGIPVTWTPLRATKRGRYGYALSSETRVGDSELDIFCNREMPYDVVVMHTVPEYYPQIMEREIGKRALGYTTWETDRIPSHWRSLLNGVDGLLVPCQWNREVFQAGGVTVPIHVVPHAIEHMTASADDFPARVDPEDYIFYSISTWTNRKAVWNVVNAYLEAFHSTDSVVLVLKTSKEDFSRPRGRVSRLLRLRYRSTRAAVAALTARFNDPGRIVILDEDLEGGQIRALHQRGDCYVSLCRGEGWGLGAFDACAAGNPVIMTGFGGQVDFLSEDAAFLVEHEVVPVNDPTGGRSYTSDQKWAEPFVESGSKWMRFAFENREEAAERGQRLQQVVTADFSVGKVTNQLVHAIQSKGT